MKKVPKDHPLVKRKYTIVTDQLSEFTNMVGFVVENGIPGMLACGPSRVGKTVSVKAAVKYLEKTMGEDVAIKSTLISTHVKSEPKRFYAEICDNLGFNFTKSSRSYNLKTLIVTYLIQEARKKNNQVLLIVDEANLMLETDYSYLMDIFNRLEAKDIRLTVVFVGTEELLKMKSSMMANNQAQILGRFMVRTFTFKPITGVEEIAEVLKGYDKTVKYLGVPVVEDCFPINHSLGKRFVDEADNVVNAINSLKEEILKEYSAQKPTKDTRRVCSKMVSSEVSIPMQYLTLAAEYILKNYGKYSGNTEKWPNEKIWKNALRCAGFREVLEIS